MIRKKVSMYSQDLLNQKRQEVDLIADKVVQSIFSNQKAKVIRETLLNYSNNQIKTADFFPDILKSYLEQSLSLPNWTNQRKIKKGQLFFQKYAQEIMGMLGFYSLPYCYAAAKGAEVLYLSEKIRQNTQQRLFETATFVLNVLHPKAFEPSGSGFINIAQVRLMHATVRYHILKSNQWNLDWGQPINQEDMAGTNLAFSLLPIRGLRKMGFSIAQEDADAFIHLWNIIGFKLGIQEDLLPQSGKEAFWLEKQIAQRHFQKSKAGIVLTKSLLETLITQSQKRDFPKEFTPTYMRFLLGNEVANLLEIPQDNWTKPLMGIFQLQNFVKNFNPLANQPQSTATLADFDKDLANLDISFGLPMVL